MKPTESLEISNEAFSKLFVTTYPISILANGHNALIDECRVLPLEDTPKRLALAVANQSAIGKELHVGDACNITIPTPNAPKALTLGEDQASNGTFYCATHTTALICATIHASIPCGAYTLYLADVTEAKFPR
jgi:hypothetical protein